jgi:hypothetical protein
VLLSLHERRGPFDPRLEKIKLSDPQAVYTALGGTEEYIGKFDAQAYFALQIGQRLLTRAEVDALPEISQRAERMMTILTSYCGMGFVFTQIMVVQTPGVITGIPKRAKRCTMMEIYQKK